MADDAAGYRPGELLAGRYRVEGDLGRGGVAIVLAVTDLTSNEPRAVKLLGRAARSLPSTVERFFREARATARLTSEHAVRVFDVGAFDDGAPYMVMEHLEGKDLAATLRRRGALPAHESALYVLHACEALAEAHANGIVHRDLKPGNLFLTRNRDGGPCVKVLDFGFSKQLTLSERQRDITLANAVLGSPAYMSPEQLMSARAVDARTDVWALGVVLYQLVTGHLPFASDDASTMLSLVMTRAPTPPSEVRAGLPLALDAVVLRCLEKEPERRYGTIVELAAALAPFVPWYRSALVPAVKAAPANRGLRRAVMVAVAVLVGALVLAVALLRG